MPDDSPAPEPPPHNPEGSAIAEVFRAFLALGCVAVGGPSAHIALLEAELVNRRRWLSPRAFTELFSVGSMLPGPTSTQVVIGCGLVRAGKWGGLVALLAWMTPGVALMTALALALGWWMHRGYGLDALRGVEPAACRELPFGFRREFLSGPSCVRLGIAECDMHDGVIVEAADRAAGSFGTAPVRTEPEVPPL